MCYFKMSFSFKTNQTKHFVTIRCVLKIFMTSFAFVFVKTNSKKIVIESFSFVVLVGQDWRLIISEKCMATTSFVLNSNSLCWDLLFL